MSLFFGMIWLVILLLAPFAIIIAGITLIVWIINRVGIAWGSLAAIIIVLIPTWDVIAGHIQFHKLCAGLKEPTVYKRVLLEPKFRDIQFPDASYRYMDLPIWKRYPHKLVETRLTGPGRIRSVETLIVDAETKEVLGKSTAYFYGGGWFENAFDSSGAGGAGGGHCGMERGSFNGLLEAVFSKP